MEIITIQQVMVGCICCDISANVENNKVFIFKVEDHETLEEYTLSFLYNSYIWQNQIKRNLLIQMFQQKYNNRLIKNE